MNTLFPEIFNRFGSLDFFVNKEKAILELRRYDLSTVTHQGQDIISPTPTARHLEILRALEKEGLLHNQWNQRRAIEVKTVEAKDDSDQIPLLGLVAAGNPILALENPTNTITVPRHFLKGHHRYFALTVKGDSMIEAGILDNDVIVCRSTNDARNGQIVVAVINGDATVKTLSYQKKRIELLPANKNYDPIVIHTGLEKNEDDNSEGIDFKIVGLLVGLLRSYQ